MPNVETMPQTAKRVKTENLPALSVTLQDDTTLDLKTIKNAVFFFYPKANTPGCTKQAHDYKEHYAEFTSKGYKVFGVSKDTCKALSTWKAKEEFQYPLISDKSGDLSKHFGLNKGASVSRGHVVIKDGKVLDIQSGIKPLESVSKALATIANPNAADDEEDEEADEPARKEPVKTKAPEAKDVVMKEAKPATAAKVDATKPVDAKKAVPASPSKVQPQTSPKKVGKEEIPVKTKEEIIHAATHDKKQEELKGKVQKELKAGEPLRKDAKKVVEQTKELKKEVLAEIAKK